MTTTSFAPVQAFYCFDPADHAFCEALDRHLAPLKQAGRMQAWGEWQVLAGSEWEREYDQHFSAARLLFLFISPDFLASETGQESMQRALRRQQKGEAVVIPVLLRPCAWEQTELQGLQMLPRDHLALTQNANQDDLWQKIVTEVSRILDSLHQRIYVIFAPEDHESAERLSQDMAHAGVTIWYPKGNQLSKDLSQEREAMRQASSVLLLASPATFSSRAVRAQTELAEVYQRPLQVVWVSGEDGEVSGRWQEEAVLDARAEHYETAKERLLTRFTQRIDVAPSVEEPPQPVSEPRNPYKGLQSFQAADTRDFFGREALIDELAVAVEQVVVQEKKGQPNERLLAVLGASGAGKSSVVQAGLLPNLKLGGVFDSREWLYLDPMVPGIHPLEALALSLAVQPSLGNVAALYRELTSDSLRALHLLVRQLVNSSSRKVVLFIDQFEEVFTLTVSEEERQHFFDLLITAVTEPQGPLLVILTLRMDFSDRATQYPTLYHLLDVHHVSVLPMQRNDLRRVIEEPARQPDVQLTFEDDLVEDLLFDMREQIGALPLLEFTLDQFFARRSGYMLTLYAYRDIGGLKGALAKHAEATYDSLPTQEHQALARSLFLRLIDPGHTEQDTTRRRARLSEFERSDSAQTKLLRETMDAFVAARLLTANEQAGEATIEVSHEALIREWSRLIEWLRAAREDIFLQQKISEDAAEWQQRSRSSDRLYRGSQFKEARAWARRNTPSQTEAAFLQSSAKQRRFTTVSILVLALFLLSLADGTVWYIHLLKPDPTLVTTQQDGPVGSLRWTVLNAPSGSTITFASNLTGRTIVLTGDLVIPGPKHLILKYSGSEKLRISLAKNTLLVDAGASLTLINFSLLGGGFSVSEGPLTNHGTLALTNSTISGSNGYGIENDGTTTLTNSTISGNNSSGIFNNFSSTMTLTNSTISGNNEDGIENDGTMTLTNSTISGNSLGGIFNDSGSTMTLTNSTISGNNDGGIFNDSGSTMTLTNSTISGNTASSTTSANGTTSGGKGGGIENGGTMTLTNSTISGNTASSTTSANGTTSGGKGGGIENDGGTIRLIFCTLYGNQATDGGGLATQDNTADSPPKIGISTIQNSLIAGNSVSTQPDVAGELTSLGYNLIQNGSDVHSQSTDRTGIPLSALQIDPSLQLNGSKTTKTHALLPGSSALDVIPLAACHPTVNSVLITTDQRGVKRPQETKCDIGAYEYVP